MAKRRTRLTGRGIAVVAALALFTVGAVTVVVVKTRAPDCVVSADGREIELDQDQAVGVSRAVAAVVRSSGTANEAAAAVLDQMDLEVDDALLVGDAFSGRARAALVCRHGGASDGEVDRLGVDGLTGRAQAVRDDMETRFGDLPLGGFAPGGVTDGHMPGSAHYEGRAIDAFFRPINGANKQHGWALAQYLVANADRLAINTVIFDAKIWTARRGDDGWRDYQVDLGNRSAATLRILEHRDHVHVDVAD